MSYIYPPGQKDGTLRNGLSFEIFEHWTMLADLVEQGVAYRGSGYIVDANGNVGADPYAADIGPDEIAFDRDSINDSDSLSSDCSDSEYLE